ncbi:MAG: universal stress protein [Ginsengibacter sp.]|jgi:nucleotide-binding universal stress UspA family protein
MKNILVAVDFSDASTNALSYAAFLANVFNTGLLLVHAYSGTSYIEDNPDTRVYESVKELEAANEKLLKKEIDGIARKFTVKVRGVVMKGNPVNVIKDVAEKNDSEIIVMGMKGKGESNSIFGSTAISMIDKTPIPLLIIPQNAGYQTIETITLASDFNDEELLSHFTLLDQFITKYDPFIQILNVQKKDSELTAEMIAGKMRTGLIWDKYNHSFNIIERDNIEDGIDQFLEKHPTNILVMVARKRNFVDKILGISHTKKMTRQIKIPLLVLHEE